MRSAYVTNENVFKENIHSSVSAYGKYEVHFSQVVSGYCNYLIN